ncbi:MAG: methyltransferase domain-containing protein [Verrucomicrobiae bacterium]|nr:methyltransferase domain-containing protein [Verrucomicrobiae bacterium]
MVNLSPEASDWEARYQAGDLRWDKGEAAPGLVDFLATHPDLPRGSVLVPGCGTGHDVRTWASAGFRATGLDIAPSAIPLAEARSSAATGQPRFRRGDFLRDTPFETFDWVFEHTLFCAIDPAHRPMYVDAVTRWLKPDGHFLAIHYLNPEDPDGPPYGVTRAELEAAFAPGLTLLEAWVPRSYPNRVDRELMLWWQRR